VQRLAKRIWQVFWGAPELVPLGGLLGFILLGSLLLALPPMHKEGAVPYVDALFTSTSALCVTGLTTVNTATDFTLGGQTLILILIQLGGLGIMAYAALALSLISLRVSLRTRSALESSLFQQETGRLFTARLRQVFAFALGIEAIGALLLFFSLVPDHSLGSAAWSAVFHSVSAFCNAGFSIYPNNLEAAKGNHVFLLVISLLIVLGGLGFVVLAELRDKLQARFVCRLAIRTRRSRVSRPDSSPLRLRLSLHTRVVIATSLILIVAGAGLLLLFGVTPQERGLGEKISAAFFQSISARTCGFNTISIGSLPLASLLVLIMLMFIGGSPGSCAGGIKTTSAAVLGARLRSLVTGRKDTVLGGWRLNPLAVRSAELLFFLAVLWNLTGVLVLSHLEGTKGNVDLQNLLFEQISAFGTVGLSTGVTPALSTGAKLWLIATMYVGRLGPLTLASLAAFRRPTPVIFPESRVMIG